MSRFPHARPSSPTRGLGLGAPCRSRRPLRGYATSRRRTIRCDAYISRNDGAPCRDEVQYRRCFDPGGIVDPVELPESILDQRAAAPPAVVRALPLAPPRTAATAVSHATASYRGAAAATHLRTDPSRLHSPLRDVRHLPVRPWHACECSGMRLPLRHTRAQATWRVISSGWAFPNGMLTYSRFTRRLCSCSSRILYCSAPTRRQRTRRRSGQTVLPTIRLNAHATASRRQ